ILAPGGHIMKRLAFLAAVACLWGGALPGSGRAGMLTLTPANAEITLGQSVTLTVSINSTDREFVPGETEFLHQVSIHLTASGPSSVTVTNFTIPSGLPSGSSFATTDPATGSAIVDFGTNTDHSFDGAVYSFDFTPTSTGTYTFAKD